jgi:hypothetical protein
VRVENPAAHSFIDVETGEVLKPAGFKRPALTKVSRGNIFDEHNGLKHIGPFGVAHADAIKGTPNRSGPVWVGKGAFDLKN